MGGKACDKYTYGRGWLPGWGLPEELATMATPANAGYALVGEILRGGPFCHRRRLRSVKNKLNGGKK